MLPDLPQIKKILNLILDGYIKRQVLKKLGPFSDVNRSVAHEGNRMRIYRADGSVEDSEFKELSSMIEISQDEMTSLTHDVLMEKIERLTDEMAIKSHSFFLSILEDSVEKTGNVIDQKGRPIDAEAIFNLINKMEIDFDESGNPVPLALDGPHQLQVKIIDILNEINSDPVLSVRLAEIYTRKRLAYRDRQAARKLVG